MKITIAGYGSVGSYVARLFSDFEPTLYDPPLGLGTADDLRDADFVIVCVPTPQLPSGACDTSIVEEVVGLADPRVAIVCHSTIAIGTTERLIAETSKPLVFVPGYAGEADDHPLRDPWSRRFLIYGGYDPAASAVQALYERAYEVAERVGPTSWCGTSATAASARRCGRASKRRAGSTPAPPSTSTPTSSTTRRRFRRCSRRSRPARPTTCSARASSDTARATRRGARRAIASSRWR